MVITSASSRTTAGGRSGALRTYAGFTSLILFFAGALASQFLFSDDGSDPASTLRTLAANPGPAVALGWTLLALAALYLGGVLFLAGATRGRGSGWGSAAVVVGLLGAVGTGLIGMHSFMTASLSQTPLGTAVETSAALDRLGGWLTPPLMACQVLSVPLFAVALWRAGLAHWWVPTAGALSFAVTFLPVPLSGQASFALALAALGWAGLNVIRRRRASGWVVEPTPAHRAWAGAVCAVALLTLSAIKDAVFAGADDPDAALAAVGTDPTPLVIEGTVALAVAALFGGTAAFLAGAVRGRGSGLAIVGTVCGILGTVSISAMGALDFLTGALSVSHAGAEVFGPLGGILFPAFLPFFLAENVMLAAFAAALWRARVTGWIPFALALVFGVAAQLHPLGPAAVGQMLLGLIVVASLSYGVLRARGALPGVARRHGMRTTAPAAAQGTLG